MTVKEMRLSFTVCGRLGLGSLFDAKLTKTAMRTGRTENPIHPEECNRAD